jgi:hypothetical protein
LKFTTKRIKGKRSFCRKDPGSFESFAIGSLAVVRGGREN